MVDTSFLDFPNKNLILKDKSNFVFEDELKIKHIKEVMLFPSTRDENGVLHMGAYKRYKLIKDTGIQANNLLEDTLCHYPQPIVHHKNGIFIGTLSGIWGHYITDGLRMIWPFVCGAYKALSNYRIYYIGWAGFKLNGSFKRLLEMLGLNIKNLHEIKEPTFFDELIIPDSSFVHRDNHIMFHDLYKKTIDRICLYSKTTDTYKKIYLSTLRNKNNCFGIKKIEKYFSSKGFKIIHPEKLSFDEQLTLFNNCETIASTDGSALHNSVFCKDNTTIIVVPRGDYCTYYQGAINYLRDFNCYYIDSSLSIFANPESPWNGPFYFYVSQNLQNFFKDNTCITEKKNFYDINSYFRYALLSNLKFDLKNNDFTNMFFNNYSKCLKKHKLKKYFAKMINCFIK